MKLGGEGEILGRRGVVPGNRREASRSGGRKGPSNGVVSGACGKGWPMRNWSIRCYSAYEARMEPLPRCHYLLPCTVIMWALIDTELKEKTTGGRDEWLKQQSSNKYKNASYHGQETTEISGMDNRTLHKWGVVPVVCQSYINICHQIEINSSWRIF